MSSSSASSSMPPALERRLKYAGPALFSYGFRPFFLGGAVWSITCIVLWIPQFMGYLSLRTAFSPLDWHIHEMLYGYVAAVVAGFLLTAIPNWTGRLPITGAPLMALAALWLAGRVAILLSAYLGILAAGLIDVAFLTTLAAVAAREVIAGRNWRNLRVLVLIGVLIAGNVAFHAEVYVSGSADYSIRIGIAAVIMLITLVGGRVVPSFTRNWLARQEKGRLPASFSRFDVASIAVSLVVARALGRTAGRCRDRRCLDRRRRGAGRSSRPMGRRSHDPRSARARSSCRLRLRADRLCTTRRLYPLSFSRAKQRWYPRLDRRRFRIDASCGDDPRQPWAHRALADRRLGHPGNISVRTLGGRVANNCRL